MCTALPMTIKSVSDYGQKFGFLPCSKCYDCRMVQQFSWSSRLRLAIESMEADKNCGCQVGFVTLTYNDDSLPVIPRCLLKDDYRHFDDDKVCFSKSHIRDFVKDVRDWLLDVYGLKKPVYLVASELGEYTRRPHYHCILAMPKRVNMELLFDRIRDYWVTRRGYGFICPRDFNGSAAHNIRPFVADINTNCVCYCAKYVVKDLAFYDDFQKDHYKKLALGYDLKGRETEIKLSDYLPFHMQSRSLGLSFLDTLDSKDAMKYLVDGFSFVGETKLHALPRYYRNKLLFDNYYIKDKDGKRLCRRRPTSFFHDNYEEIYRDKVSKVEEVVKHWLSASYWSNLGYEVNCPTFVNHLSKIRKYNMEITSIAEFYVSYFGVDQSKCITDLPKSLFWFNRYMDAPLDYDELCRDDVYLDWSQHVVNLQLYDDFCRFFSVCHCLENDFIIDLKRENLRADRRKRFIRDFHNHNKGY